jgi:tetratricopeptide (TPR) repeat protein
MAAATLLFAAFVAAMLASAPDVRGAVRKRPPASKHSAPDSTASERTRVTPGENPTLLLPPRRPAGADSIPESEPAPLIVPGGPALVDSESTKSPARRAREQFLLGVALEKDGQLAAAMTAYRSAVLYDSTIADASYRMGLLYLERNRVREAARAFAAEVKRHPWHVDADRELGIAYARLGDTKHGLARLERLTRLHPVDDESWRALGFVYSSAQRPADAEKAYLHAVRLGPHRAVEHRDLGAFYATQGRDREAREEYHRALEIDPDDASVWYDLGNLERKAGHLDAALDDYQKAESRDSSFALAIQGQVQTQIQRGSEKEAGETYRRWLKSRPDDHNARLEAVRLFDGLGRHDIALELARDGVRRSPRSGDAYVILGMALASGGATRSGLEAMRHAEKLFHIPEEDENVEALIAALRAGAPDSLRAMFDADSVAHAKKSRR